MLTYALGRGLESYDNPSVAKIVAQLAANDYKFDTLVAGITESLPFQNRGSASAGPVTAPVTGKKSVSSSPIVKLSPSVKPPGIAGTSDERKTPQ
jgi:hypothetical protein